MSLSRLELLKRATAVVVASRLKWVGVGRESPVSSVDDTVTAAVLSAGL